MEKVSINKTKYLDNRYGILRAFYRVIYHPTFAFILFFILMLGLLNMVKMVNPDDFEISAVHLQYSLPEYLAYTYQHQGGRFFSDILQYYFGWMQPLWKWLCAISITMCAYVIYKFLTFSPKIGTREKILLAYLSCFSITTLNSSILSPAIFWITGGLGYLIPFTVGLIAFTPFFMTLLDENYRPNYAIFLFLIPSIMTAMSQEQIPLCFIVFMFIVLVYLLIKRKKIPGILWIIFITTVSLQIFSLTTPGIINRFYASVSVSEFYTTSLGTRIAIMFYFLMNTIVNQWYFLLLLLWIITAILLQQSNSSIFAKIITALSYFYSLLTGFKYITFPELKIAGEINYLIDRIFIFHFITTKSLEITPWHFITYFIWMIGILIIPISLYLIFKKTKYSLFYIALYLAAIASISIIACTPQLFISGGRTSFVSNMLLLILILFLLRYNGLSKVFAGPIIAMGILGIVMFYLYWQTNGFKIFMGHLDTTTIPSFIRVK